MDCIFCKIIDGEIKTDIIYQDEDVIAINDINPQAPVHVLLITKKHIPSILVLDEAGDILSPKITRALKKVTAQLGLDRNGFRVINNCGKAAGQTIDHLHYHILGGRDMGEKIV